MTVRMGYGWAHDAAVRRLLEGAERHIPLDEFITIAMEVADTFDARIITAKKLPIMREEDDMHRDAIITLLRGLDQEVSGMCGDLSTTPVEITAG